ARLLQPVEKMSAACSTKSALGPIGRFEDGDLILAFPLHAVFALRREERTAAPRPTHRAMAGADAGARIDGNLHRPAKAASLAFDLIRHVHPPPCRALLIRTAHRLRPAAA